MAPAATTPKTKRPARRRKRNRRTEVSSSESSSDSSSSSESEDERPAKIKTKRTEEDVSMKDVEVAAPAKEDSDSSSSSESEDDEDEASTRIPVDEDMGEMISDPLPTPLTRLRDPTTSANDALTAAKFEEYYMRLITTEFADSLDEIRKAQDFGEGSLPMLVRQLKQGVNIFRGSEKETVVEAEKRVLMERR